MGQKIDPRGFRLAITRDWSSRWYANSQSFASNLLEDIKSSKLFELMLFCFPKINCISKIVFI